MTIEEVVKRKWDMEAAIKTAVESFCRETGITVNGVYLTNNRVWKDGKAFAVVYRVETQVTL